MLEKEQADDGRALCGHLVIMEMCQHRVGPTTARGNGEAHRADGTRSGATAADASAGCSRQARPAPPSCLPGEFQRICGRDAGAKPTHFTLALCGILNNFAHLKPWLLPTENLAPTLCPSWPLQPVLLSPISYILRPGTLPAGRSGLGPNMCSQQSLVS